MNKSISIKIIGVGGAGSNLVERMSQAGLAGVEFAVLNTDEAAMERAATWEKVHLESKLLRGLGTGGDPGLGRAAAEEHAAALKSLCAGVDVVLILGGLGGGTATGACPVLARMAKESGALVLAFATLPFDCEGHRRQRQARQGLEQLKAAADAVVCLHNQRVFNLIDEHTTVRDTFSVTNQLLTDGVRGVWQLLTRTGLIDVRFADLCAVVRGRHSESSFASIETSGPNRSREALDQLFKHPLLDNGQMLGEADEVLVSLMGGADLTMADVNRVMEQINRHCEKAQIIMGAAIDESFDGRLSVTVIVSQRKGAPKVDATEEETPGDDGPNAAFQELGGQLLGRAEAARPASRIVPPPPALTAETREQLLARQNGAAKRSRKNAQRMRQAQLPLDIISKGRFDKSEPTIYRGEDLDVPTYIRRGVVLN